MSAEGKQLTTEEEVGNYIALDRRFGDRVTVVCKEQTVDGEVTEIRTKEAPLIEHQRKEILVSDGETTIGLYAEVNEVTELSIDYDVYAIQIVNNIALGKIKKIVVHPT